MITEELNEKENCESVQAGCYVDYDSFRDLIQFNIVGNANLRGTMSFLSALVNTGKKVRVGGVDIGIHEENDLDSYVAVLVAVGEEIGKLKQEKQRKNKKQMAQKTLSDDVLIEVFTILMGRSPLPGERVEIITNDCDD